MEHKTSGGNGEKRPTVTEPLHIIEKFQYGTGNVHTWFDTERDAAGAQWNVLYAGRTVSVRLGTGTRTGSRWCRGRRWSR